MSFLKKHFKKVIGIIIVLIIIFIFIKVKSNPTDNQTEFNSKTQTIINPTIGTIKDEITLTGSISASQKATLHFQTNGQLYWVGVQVGDTVKKGQSIASLNKDSLQKQLEIYYNNYQSAATNFYDTTDQYKDSVITDEIRRILERNQNTLDNSVATYELQDLAIKYATLTTPIAGIVVSVDQPNSGVNVTYADNIATIVDPQSIYFYAKIDQEDVPKIKVGDLTTITLDSFPDQVFESTVTYIAFTPVTSETSTVYEIRFNLPQDENSDLKYRLGMDGDVSILIQEKNNVLIIPIDSIYQDNDQQYVLVKTDESDILTKKYITTGIETDTDIEILEGLSPNDQIVIAK